MTIVDISPDMLPASGGVGTAGSADVRASRRPTPGTGIVAEPACRRSETGRRSFDEVYAERYEPMLRLACCLVDLRPVAEDIVQDSFRQLWQRWDSVSTPSSYLRTSVVNGCHNELRRRRVRRESRHKLFDRPDSDNDYLADALAGIAEPRRRALVLRFYGGHTMNEIAAAMDVPTGTAKSLIHRGLADLRGALH